MDGEYSAKGWNRYMYVGGNPIRYKDPTGHMGVDGTAMGLDDDPSYKDEEYRQQNIKNEEIKKKLQAAKDSKIKAIWGNKKLSANERIKRIIDAGGVKHETFPDLGLSGPKSSLVKLGNLAKTKLGKKIVNSKIINKAKDTISKYANKLLPKRKIHGNSFKTKKPARGYTLRDRDTGEILKYGETTLDKKRYTKKFLKENNADMVFGPKGSKKAMHEWQHKKILEYKEGER